MTPAAGTAESAGPAGGATAEPAPVRPVPVVTAAAGERAVRFVPVDPGDDSHITLVHAWLNAPHVVPFWQTALPLAEIRDYLETQARSAHSRPFLAELAQAAGGAAGPRGGGAATGTDPAGDRIGYLELYRADLDPLAEHYDAHPHDLGIHLLIGAVERTGRGLGTTLIAAARDALLAGHPESGRVVAEPDVRNVASVRAFAAADFDHRGELALPEKTAALMVYDRKETG